MQNNAVVVPRGLKQVLNLYAPQFMGYNQQDSQEVAVFLLDGLHEDLNRIVDKPYCEVREWNIEGDEFL